MDTVVAHIVQYLSELGGLYEHRGANVPNPRENDTGCGDDPSMMLICVKKLRAEGFTVLEAEGSSEALKILDTHHQPIDLVLTDLMLPPPGLQLSASKIHIHGSMATTSSNVPWR